MYLPRGNRKALTEYAARFGLHVATWSPGDGATRYRFFPRKSGEPQPSYSDDFGLGTAVGLADAWAWLEGFVAGREFQARHG